MRRASIHRKTNETEIRIALTLEGHGRSTISTGIRFLDHMLELLARHGAFDLKLEATGDLDVDQHHTVEDVGIALGEAFTQALGTKRGILRAGYFVMPMDETLGSGRRRLRRTQRGRSRHQGPNSAGRGSTIRTRRRLLRRFRTRSESQCACQGALWPLQSPQD